MYHRDEIFRHLGYSDRAREAALRFWRMLFDGLVLYAHGDVPIPAGVMEGELSTAYFGLDYDPIPDWRRLGQRGQQPVLAVYGAEDRLTPVPETAARLRAALVGAGARDVDVRVFPGAGHTVTTRQTGLRFDWDSAFAPRYLETVTEWMRADGWTCRGPAGRRVGGVSWLARLCLVRAVRPSPMVWASTRSSRPS